MGILDKDFGKAIRSTEASILRGKMGVEKANYLIQTLNNSVNKRHHSGYDIKKK